MWRGVLTYVYVYVGGNNEGDPDGRCVRSAGKKKGRHSRCVVAAGGVKSGAASHPCKSLCNPLAPVNQQL